MLPIQKLLNRIRWDPRFRAGGSESVITTAG
jgi:hypothetical protein